MAETYDYTIDYNEQMLNYYPEVIKAIREFQVLINTQSVEVSRLHEELTRLLGNAYIVSADENRINMWEQFLGITPLPQGDDSLETWLSDRRETIMARIYQTPKLNTESISNVVNIFTGGSATSYFKDGIIHVLISPPRDNKKFKFENVEQELKQKAPAHLFFSVMRNYQAWAKIKTDHITWGDVLADHSDWGEVLHPVLD